MQGEYLVDLFLELVAIDSESLKEGPIARHITGMVEGWGCEVHMDRAGKSIGSDAGNLNIRTPAWRHKAKSKGAPPLLLSAHMDTVHPGEGIVPLVGKRTIRSQGHTVLGADNKAGVAIILDILREVSAGRMEAGPLEVLLSVAEEKGILGIKYADMKRVRADHALVLDGTGEAGIIVNAAPTQDNLEFVFQGKRAHAGVEPEKGLNAIAGAARAISRMKLGRIDAETTANIGIIEGGTAVNIVPDRVLVKGEARSHDPAKLEKQRERMIEAVRRAEEDGMDVAVEVTRAYEGYRVPANDPLIHLVKKAAAAEGIKMRVKASGGGSDANFLNTRGIKAIVMNTGAFNPHSEKEYLDLAEFRKASAICRRAVEMYARQYGG